MPQAKSKINELVERELRKFESLFLKRMPIQVEVDAEYFFRQFANKIIKEIKKNKDEET